LWTLSNLSRGGFRTADYYETVRGGRKDEDW
jgi:hypothetical protein